jgi:hypothetical protein
MRPFEPGMNVTRITLKGR